YAGYVAQRMGLPVDRLVIATNVNDILARTLATGTYELRDVVATTSPSMDIQVSSNFERLLFDAYDRDGAAIRALMGALAQSQNRQFRRSAYRGRHCSGREGAARPGGADGGAVDRACGEIPRCGRGGLRGAAATAGMAWRSR